MTTEEMTALENAIRAQADGKSVAERVRLSLELKAAQDAERDARRAQKAAWIKAARETFNPGAPQSCVVCGEHRGVAEAHHLWPLEAQPADGEPDHRHVWLCPTHHAGVHLILSSKIYAEGFSDRELYRMENIARMTGRA